MTHDRNLVGGQAKAVLRFRARGEAATPQGLAIENRGKGCYNEKSDGSKIKAVLEFVAVGK